MKFTAISDLHGYLPKDLPGGDVLCICGDIVPLDYQSDFTQSVAWFCLDFAPWADSQPYRKVVFIGGNHDFFLQELGERHRPSSVMKRLLPGPHKGQSKLVYLCDDSVEIDGIRIYGTPWIADLARWAFLQHNDELRLAGACGCHQREGYRLCPLRSRPHRQPFPGAFRLRQECGECLPQGRELQDCVQTFQF